MAEFTAVFCRCVFILLLHNLDFVVELRSQPFPVNRMKRQSKDQITCVLPNHPSNGELTILESDQTYLPNSSVILNTIIDLSCREGYGIDTGRFARAICYNGVWTPAISKMARCARTCPAIQTETDRYFASCIQANRNVSCNKPVEGTLAEITCKLRDIKSSTTCRNGSWDNEILPCESEFPQSHCERTIYGCCPDKTSAAAGNNYEGCTSPPPSCFFSEFGCCKDNVTAATGPNQLGCSELGCCLDEITSGRGHNHLEVPGNPQAYCSLPKERGTCKNYGVYWFYDLEYGGCSRFWYGGCGGNGNKFKSEKECQSICVEPQGKGLCNLSKVEGPCEGHYPQWFYSRAHNQCLQFIYRGCKGNTNRFDTVEECKTFCLKDNKLIKSKPSM